MAELTATGVLWLALVLLSLAFRAFLVLFFHAKLPPDLEPDSVFYAFRTGFCSDVLVASYWTLPALAAALAALPWPGSRWPARVRNATALLAVIVFALVFVTDATYFAEYGNQFDDWIFGLVYDDRGAILGTVWKSYPVVWLLLATFAAAGVTWLGLRAAMRRVTRTRTRTTGSVRLVGALAVLVLAILGLRGSIGRRPLQEKDLAATGNETLNRLVPNPFLALYLATRDELRLRTAAGIRSFLPDGDVRAAARALFPDRSGAADLDAALERRAPGAPERHARHLFLVVMESYDAWAMEPKFQSLHLTDRLAALGRDGFAVRSFLPAGSGTIKSLGAIISGIPATGVFVSHEPSLRDGVPTAAARIFHRLGYRTRFFYGGYLSWERVGEFAREQGFDEVYGGDQMGAQATGNEWGVDDDVLFRFILDHTGDAPTFDVVMSTSYHPPFSVDVVAKGFDLAGLRANPLCRGLTERQLLTLGHLWYSDQSLGDFVQAALSRLPESLFALTGDHYSREESVNPRPDLFESTAVPFVLYGPGVLPTRDLPGARGGSHIDIVPTLVDLVAPAGFSYPAFGRDMLDLAAPQVGFGDLTVSAPMFLFRVRDPDHVEDLDGARVGIRPDISAALAQRYQQLHGLAWWREHHGPAWP
ncbi:MAG TPA: LTA synthase family protein [Myxococcota bacterium]|nr:LTA synthase family protein [Myxococcota bacterium]